jgi:hypothetical protein
MADTKWTKGSGGNWNDAANWDNGVPDSSKNAIFDAASFSADGNTVTINAANCACANLDFSAIDQTVTFANSTYTDFKVYGNLVLPATKLTWSFTGTGYVTLAGTGSQTITTNGMTSNMNRLYFDGVGGTWTNQDAANFGSTSLYLKNGTWATNNQTITSTGSFVTEAGTKVLTLGSSTFNIGTWNNAVPTGLTITSAGNTSTVNITAASTLTGATTFYNLTFTGTAAITAAVSLAADITVSNVFTPTGNNATDKRLLVASNTIGTQRTITTASISASNVDFRDIKLAGACNKDLSTEVLCPGGSGDCGGNTDITFSTPETKYYKHTSGACTWKDTTKWVTTSGGSTTSTARFLPQDSHILDANSFTGTSTLTIDVPRKGSVDMSAVNQAVTTSLANAVGYYGNLILGNNITPSGNYARILMGRGRYSLNLYGKSINDLGITSYTGEYTNYSDILTATFFTQNSGVFNCGNYNISVIRFQVLGGTFNGGSGIIECTRTTGTLINIASSSTFNCGTTTIKFTPSSGSSDLDIILSGKTLYNVWFSGSHTGYFDITGSNTFNELKIDPGRKVRITAGTTQTVSKLNAVGTQANPITLTSVTSATHTLALASGQPNPQCDWMNISYSIAPTAEASKFYAGNGSVDGGNNTGWVFRNISKGMLALF